VCETLLINLLTRSTRRLTFHPQVIHTVNATYPQVIHIFVYQINTV